MKFLLDTNICIFAIKNRPESVLRKIHAKMTTGIGLSTVTIAELEFGVSNSLRPEQNRMALMEFLTIFESITFSDSDAAAYGPLRADLKKRGCLIGQLDMLIAAQAVSRNLTLVTNNTQEFSRVPQLKLEDWTT